MPFLLIAVFSLGLLLIWASWFDAKTADDRRSAAICQWFGCAFLKAGCALFVAWCLWNAVFGQ